MKNFLQKQYRLLKKRIFKILHINKINNTLLRLWRAIETVLRPVWVVAVVGFLLLASLVAFQVLAIASSIILMLLLLQCLIAIGLALSEPRSHRTHRLQLKTIFGIGAALVAAMVTGWLWWQQWTASEQTNITLRSQAAMQDQLLRKTTTTLAQLDSSLIQLAELRRVHSALTLRADQITSQLQKAEALQESLNRTTQERLKEIQELQFPLHVESLRWAELKKGYLPKDFFRYICECYPHVVPNGVRSISAPRVRGRQSVAFWYQTADSMMGIPIKLEERIQIPRGSDILKYLYDCKSEAVVLERVDLAHWAFSLINILEMRKILGMLHSSGIQSDPSSAWALSDSMRFAKQLVERAIAFGDTLQARRWNDETWLLSVAEDRRRGGLLSMKKDLELKTSPMYANTMRWVMRMLPSVMLGDTNTTWSFSDSMMHAKKMFQLLIDDLELEIAQTSDSLRSGKSYDEEAAKKARMASAIFSLGYGHPGMRWFSVFKTLPDMPTEAQWSSDREAEETFLEGDLAIVAEVPNMDMFDFQGQFQKARGSGKDALNDYYTAFAEMPWPVNMAMEFSKNEVWTQFEGSVKIVNDSGRLVSVCDLEGSWFCTPQWQDDPPPEYIELVFVNGKKVLFLREEFKIGPYGWRWLQITRKHLKAFGQCAESDENLND